MTVSNQRTQFDSANSGCTPCSVATSRSQLNPGKHSAPTPPTVSLPIVLYDAAYYHEYEPYERLYQDVHLMKSAGLNVVRMGESTWSLWEPEDGHFEYAWMDRAVDALGKAGIKVIMGTPTYSILGFTLLARPLGGVKTFYGMRHPWIYLSFLRAKSHYEFPSPQKINFAAN